MANKFAFVEGTVIDGSGDKPIQNGVVLVEDGKVTQVGTSDSVKVPSDATKVDCSAKTVMPGLIDCHVHLVTQPDGSPYTGFGLTRMSLAGWAIESVASARDTLRAGITTVRDVGALANVTPELRDAIEAGRIEGPRILSCNMGISITGGHGDIFKHTRFEALEDAPGISLTADGVDAVRAAVRKEIKAGADWIKVFASGGALETAKGRIDAMEFSIEELKAIIEEAARAGKSCAAHCLPDRQIRNCVDAGFRTIEHGVFAKRETLEKMKEKGVFFVPTLTPYYWYATENLNLPDTTVEAARAATKAHQETFKNAMATGVKIASGTDAGAPRIPLALGAKELEVMVKFGMAPLRAITSATKESAEALRIDDQTGTLEPGKCADVLVVDGDVLKDITILQRRDKLSTIMKAGVQVKRPSA